MSYLNQKTTLKKLLLSTAIISSVACLSSQVFAMDPPMEEGKNRTPITGKLIKDNESVVSLMYKGEYGIGHNSVLFEWKEAEDNKPKACLVAYGGVQNALTPVTRVITDILTDDMMQVADGASSMAKAAISNLIWGDISVPGVVMILDDVDQVSNYKNTYNWVTRASWIKSKEDAENGRKKAREIQMHPPRYSIIAHLPVVDVDKQFHNCLSMSAALLYSSGIREFNEVFIGCPSVWKPQGS